MAKVRQINTKFWDDEYISCLTPLQKYLFLYLLTNPLTNISGIYEITMKRIVFDTGLTKDEVNDGMGAFVAADKVYYAKGWVYIKNFQKHQSLGEKIQKGIAYQMQDIPDEVLRVFNLEVPDVPVRHTAVEKPKSEPKEKKTDGMTPREKAESFFSDSVTQELVVQRLIAKNIPEHIVRNEVKKFIMRWTELNGSGTKQKWQLEKTFDVSGRLVTWFGRIQEFNKFNKPVQKAEEL